MVALEPINEAFHIARRAADVLRDVVSYGRLW